MPSDWQDVAVVEALLDLPPDLVQPGRATSELRGQSRIVVNRPNLVEVEVNVNYTALCVLSDRFDDDWKAELRSSEEEAGRPVEILRTNRLLRGVVIPPGRHRLVFDYRPLSVRIGGWLTILGWTLLAAHAGNTIVINAKFAEEESF